MFLIATSRVLIGPRDLGNGEPVLIAQREQFRGVAIGIGVVGGSHPGLLALAADEASTHGVIRLLRDRVPVAVDRTESHRVRMTGEARARGERDVILHERDAVDAGKR